jgi:hypothetical protein
MHVLYKRAFIMAELVDCKINCGLFCLKSCF